MRAEAAEPMMNADATLIREVASKTNDSAGDGTPTAFVLAREIIKLGLRNVTSGVNPVNTKKGTDRSVQGLVEELERKARPVKGRGLRRHIRRGTHQRASSPFSPTPTCRRGAGTRPSRRLRA